MRNPFIFLILTILCFGNCSNETGNGGIKLGEEQKLTIFFVNDQHGHIDNFAKIKHIVDEEKKEHAVILACSGDLFSGNPIVDNHPKKGYPMIDIMNKTGFDISVIGNHEFDYGDQVLAERIEQANFKWVCANVDMSKTNITQPAAFENIVTDDLKITFLGLVETNGKENGTIPSTHPWKVKDIEFKRPEHVVDEYSAIKKEEDADLYIALTHLGHSGYGGTLGDYQLASQYPYFDLIIGGHSHYRVDTTINKIPVFQAGSYLKYLGKIELAISDKKISSYTYSLINLDTYQEIDAELKAIIDDYNDLPELKEVVGFSHNYHNNAKVGCFFTDALRGAMKVDVTFQNTGGIRSDLDEGDITKREIYEIDPFNNGTVIYTMKVSEIISFLKETRSGFYFSGIRIEQGGTEIRIKDLSGNILANDSELTVGMNDYLPAVHEAYFPENGKMQDLTSAESLIYYLENINKDVNYAYCDHYFRYQ